MYAIRSYYGYSDGAYYPTEHFSSFIEAIAGVIERAPGCDVVYEAEVSEVRESHLRISLSC